MADKFAGGIKPGSTQNVSTVILLRSTADGTEMTGVAAASVSAFFLRQGGLPVEIAVVALAAVDSPYSSGGWKEIDAVDMPGAYRLDLPNSMLLSGADWALLEVVVAGAFAYPERYSLESKGAAEVFVEAALGRKWRHNRVWLRDGAHADVQALEPAATAGQIWAVLYDDDGTTPIYAQHLLRFDGAECAIGGPGATHREAAVS